MNDTGSMHRRAFLSVTAGAALAGAIPAQAQAQPAPAGADGKLAIEGGAKTVTESAVTTRQFGAPERERLEEMLGQDTLFYWKGPQTAIMTERFRQFCPAEHVMPCSSGTAALHIAVAAAGIAPGDEVITTPITDIGSVVGVLYQQGVPVFADLGASTYNLDVAAVEAAITPKTKAIIAVHLTGNPCDLDALRALADRHGLVLIEDACQAWGAKYHGRPIGTVGHIACWSLQNSKHITCGDGGIVASSDPKFGPLLQRFGDKGVDRTNPGPFEFFSTNYRMSEPQAAVVAGQLTRLEEIAARRSQLGNRLTTGIQGVKGVLPHAVHPEDRAVYWFYMFRVDPAAFSCDRAKFVQALSSEGVQCSAGYIPVPMHKNPVFMKHAFFGGHWPVKEMGLTSMDYSKHETPEANKILETGVRVTIHEAMSETLIDQTADAIRKVAAHFAV